MSSHQSESPSSAMDFARAALHDGVYEPERPNDFTMSGHRWNEYRSIMRQNPQWPSCPSPAVSNRTTGPAGGLRMKSTMRSIWGAADPDRGIRADAKHGSLVRCGLDGEPL